MNTLRTVLAASILLIACRVAAMDYQVVPGWLKLPPGKTQFGNQHGDIAVSSQGEIYVSSMDPAAGIQVYSANGDFLRNVPGAPNDFHGFRIHREAGGEFIYGARLSGQSILKMTLDGRVVLTIPGSAVPDRFKTLTKGKPTLKLTGIDVAPNGDIYVSDGYGSDYIHRFDREGHYLGSFGGKKAPYNFNTAHKIIVDTRFTPARLLCCDRKNMRLVHLSLDGEFLGVFAQDLLLPSALAIRGDDIAVGELKGRVTILDKAGHVVVHFGENTHDNETATNKTPPSVWRTGIFNAAHGIAFDAAGNLYVSEWSLFGRVHRFDLQ